ncbi:MAG: PorT family protein [Dysgonamonadaceae bacterium]|jgi:hypothetical protein|nr:PorT family protein [Dysgonamonadaceae bacterium]
MKKPNKEELFKESLRESADALEMPVSDEVWNRIEATLVRRRKRKRLAIWLPSAAAAAAAAVLLLIMLPLNTPVSKEVLTVNHCNQVQEIEAPTPEDIPHVRMVKAKAEKAIAENVMPAQVEQPVAESSNKTPPQTISRKDEKQRGNISPRNEEDIVLTVKKRKKKTSIGLLFGSGNGYLTENGSNKSYFTGSEASSLEGFNKYPARTEERLDMEDFPEAVHRPPVSFGVSFRKELNTVFSLETGIVYSLLRTDFKNKGRNKKATLYLHYIGIPVNVQAKLAGSRSGKWNIYLTAGGMVEKGIYSRYRQEDIILNNKTKILVANEKIDGLQYSLSIAPGVDYRILRNYSVFIEPKLSYYFDNHQPVSARTEHPVVFGVNAGLRLGF